MGNSNDSTSPQQTNGNGGVLHARLPWGIAIDIKGQFFAIILVLALVVGTGAMFAWRYTEGLTQQHTAIAATLDDIYNQHQDMIDQLALMNYLLSLPQDKRPELTPPPSVYRKLLESVTPATREKLEAKHQQQQVEARLPRRNANKQATD